MATDTTEVVTDVDSNVGVCASSANEKAGAHTHFLPKLVLSLMRRAVGSASDTSNDKVLYQPYHPVARQSDFKKKGCKKDNASRSSHLHCRSPVLDRTLSTSWLENIKNHISFQDARQSLRVRNTPVF